MCERTAWIGGLPEDAAQQDVRNMVENCGNVPRIVSCNVRQNERGKYAFIQFEDAKGVQMIIDTLHNTMYGGNSISVRRDTRHMRAKGKGTGKGKGKGKGGLSIAPWDPRSSSRSPADHRYHEDRRSRSRDRQWSLAWEPELWRPILSIRNLPNYLIASEAGLRSARGFVRGQGGDILLSGDKSAKMSSPWMHCVETVPKEISKRNCAQYATYLVSVLLLGGTSWKRFLAKLRRGLLFTWFSIAVRTTKPR